MNKSHWASMILSLLAFLLFVINVFFEMAYQTPLDLRGPFGALILTGFLSIGLIIQVSKFLEGHKNRMDVLVSLLLLPLHIGAEITIWVRTQILHIGLPAELPFWMIGAYWMIGLIDVLAPRIGPELSKLRPSYISSEQMVVVLKQDVALLEQRLSITKAVQEQVEANKSTLFRDECSICGEVFEKSTREAARNARIGHGNRKHKGQNNAVPVIRVQQPASLPAESSAFVPVMERVETPPTADPQPTDPRYLESRGIPADQTGPLADDFSGPKDEF